METMLKGAAPQAAPADLIKDSDQTKFAKDVLEASRTVPVIVDFWAPWCGPCKTLGPMIEKAVRNANGAVRLVTTGLDAFADEVALHEQGTCSAAHARGGPRRSSLPVPPVRNAVDDTAKEDLR